MTFRIRQIEFTADHRRIVRDRMVEATVLTIGRATSNDIALPDLAVELDHATLRMDGPARIVARATGTLGFEIEGRSSREAVIDAATGAELRFGSHRLGIHRDEDGAILIEVENMAASGGLPDPVEDKRGFSLHGAMRGKRLAAWTAAIAILLLFLAWPISSHLAGRQAVAATAHAVTGDKAWSPGALSLAHQSLGDRCEACHVKPFQSVRNETCQGCHKGTQDHADAHSLAAAHGRAGLGKTMLDRIGASFGREPPGACTDCHVEHQGKQAMATPRQQFCADCHAALRDKLPETKLGNAADFGTAHPQFAVSIIRNAEIGARTRVSLDDHPREDDGLVFSHRLHLDSQGGVARMAQSLGREGYGKPLDCASCHQRSADGVRFQPVSMERSCEACHSLAYARAGGTTLKLRHGDLDQAIADLRRAGPSAGGGTARSRPGQFGSGGLYHADFGGRYPSTDPLAPGGACAECHVPVRRGGKRAIGHVALVNRYLPSGWFDHSAHTQSRCTDCHLAPPSDTSSDVLIPGIDTCRDCHLGETAAAPKVASGCVMCHAFHPTGGAPAATRRHRPATLPPGPTAAIARWPDE